MLDRTFGHGLVLTAAVSAVRALPQLLDYVDCGQARCTRIIARERSRRRASSS